MDRKKGFFPSKSDLTPLGMGSFSSLDTSTLSARVYHRLLTAIVRQELPAGHSLDVDKLAATFGVSRTPVQRAISRLTDLGLVEIRPRRGTFVTSLTIEDVHQLFEIRSVIEVYAVRRGVKLATDNELEELKDRIEALQVFFSGDTYIDYHAFLEQDREFHSAVVALTHNRRLVEMYDQARILIELTRASAKKQIRGALLSHQRHIAIVESLRSRDEHRVVEAVEKHISESEQAILARLHLPAESSGRDEQAEGEE